jgi:hypothetical protein
MFLLTTFIRYISGEIHAISFVRDHLGHTRTTSSCSVKYGRLRLGR